MVRESYTVRESWLRHGEKAVDCEQSCELGTRHILLTAVSVIYRAANRYVERTLPTAPRWG